MAQGSRVCPHCGALNAVDERQCHKCGQDIPGPLAASAFAALRDTLGTDFPLTKFFMALCVAVFAACLLDGEGFQLLGMSTKTAVAWGAFGQVPELGLHGLGQPLRTLSSMFVHAGALHIVFNMMALWDFGRATEQRIGPARFALVFLATGFAGSVASELWHTVLLGGDQYLVVGASGGLFGLAGALVGFLYAARDPVWKKFFEHMAALAAVFVFLPLPIANAAHFGGLVAGLPLGYLAFKERLPWKRNALFGWLAGILAVTCVLSVVFSRVYS